MENYYLAVDIGASSGRHVLGYLENDKLVLEEVYRSPNSLKLLSVIRYGMLMEIENLYFAIEHLNPTGKFSYRIFNFAC